MPEKIMSVFDSITSFIVCHWSNIIGSVLSVIAGFFIRILSKLIKFIRVKEKKLLAMLHRE